MAPFTFFVWLLTCAIWSTVWRFIKLGVPAFRLKPEATGVWLCEPANREPANRDSRTIRS